MNKIIILVSLVFTILLLLSSCNENRGIFMNEGKKADIRIEQIISAIKNNDREAIKSLFSKKALDEAIHFDNEVDYLFDLFQGDIEFWERDGFSSSGSINYGKKSEMIRFAFDVKTNEEVYLFFVIDYNVDTINPDNQGVYMIELIKFIREEDLETWQERMRAGIYIH